MKLKVYEYKKCSTCRNALKFLDKFSISYEKIDITEQAPSVKELEKMLSLKEGNLKALFNTSGEVYREMKISEKLPTMKEKDALKLLASNGRLVKRPFVIGNGVGLVGFKEEEWKALR